VPPTFTDTYPNYVAALAECGSGYNDPDLTEVIAFKTAQPIDRGSPAPEQAVNSIVAVGIAAAAIGHRQLNVLDFGGGCCFHYRRVVAAMQTPLRWAIVETPVMTARAMQLGGNYFHAFTTITDAATALGLVDLIHASGSIPYVPDPLSTLEVLAALQPRYIMLARFPIWRETPVVAIQKSLLSQKWHRPNAA
jgi:putative methyltransferase (TIGR04325 family)